MTKISGCIFILAALAIMLEIWTLQLIASHKERKGNNIVVFSLTIYIIDNSYTIVM